MAKTKTTLLQACAKCSSEKVYTIGYSGEWWCECRMCGDKGPRQQSVGAAIRGWTDHVAIEREMNPIRTF